MTLPEVREISKIIDAIRDYAVTSARAYYKEHVTETYHAPYLSCWDASMWFELLQNWELSNFLVSGTDNARKLVKSLQSCLQWSGQTEINEISSRIKVISMLN